MPRQITKPPASIIRAILLSMLSGILLSLPFSFGGLWLLAWFGFIPLFLSFNNRSDKAAFFLSFITGIIFWWFTIYWLAHVTLPGTAILVFYLALYFGLFGLLIRPFTRHSTPSVLLFIPSVWVLLEYARSHLMTGFPWALLGYSQYINLPVIQIADITGGWGVSFLIIFVNVAIVEIIWLAREKSWVRLKKTIISTALLLSLILSYGYYRIFAIGSAGRESGRVKVCVIQGNIPQELKWDGGARDFIIERYSRLTLEAAKDKAALIIWPEASFPGILGDDDLLFSRILALNKTTRTPLLMGAVSYEDKSYFNSAVLLNNGEVITRYDKVHLVPFGEYIPLKNVFPFLETIVPIGDITAGNKYAIFELPSPGSRTKTKFAVLICFEDLFPELSREFVRRGADFLVNITNDAWYKKTKAAYQHLQASVFRAVENRVYLARSANTGISGFISPSGRIISLVKDKDGRQIFIGGFNTRYVFAPEWPRSFYNRYGDIFIFACFFLAFYCIIAPIFKRR